MTKTTSVRNKHKVCRDQWRKWSAEQRALFNGTYDDIMNVGADLFLHPVTVQRKLSDEEFQVIAWNAAWTAADILKKDFTFEVVTYHEGQIIAVDPVRKRAA